MYLKKDTMLSEGGTPELLDMKGMQTLLEETETVMSAHGVKLEDAESMKNIYKDRATASMYIDSLAEGLSFEDAGHFKTLCNNMLDEITGVNGKQILNALCEDNNISAGFMPKAKVLFPMFRFVWPRLHIREICTVLPIDSPEATRYFFKAIAKNADDSIVPLPSYSPIGNGVAIGTMATPKVINTPSTEDLLVTIAPGDKRKVVHLEKNFMIVGWEGTDPTGAAVTDVDGTTPIIYTVDSDGKFEMHIDCDPKNTGVNAVIDVVSGFIDFAKGIVSVSNSRSAEANGKVTKIKVVCSATSSEHNIAPRIVFDSKQVKFQVKDVQLQSEWSEQYAYDMSKRTGMDVIAELTCILGNQTQLTINKTILDDILYSVGRHGDNIRKFIADPKKARAAFAYTKKEWAGELLYHLEKVSARIYTATNNMEATHIVINPEDLVWLQMLDSFSFNGEYAKNGTYGRTNVGTISNGKQVISTPLMPQGYILLASKPSDVTLANYIYAPYVPMTISPYPLGNIPAMTFTTRFANAMIRPEGFGMVRIY